MRSEIDLLCRLGPSERALYGMGEGEPDILRKRLRALHLDRIQSDSPRNVHPSLCVSLRHGDIEGIWLMFRYNHDPGEPALSATSPIPSYGSRMRPLVALLSMVPKTSKSKAIEAPPEGAAQPTPARTAARTVYDILELRDAIFKLVDRRTLARMWLEKAAVPSVVGALYEAVTRAEMKRAVMSNKGCVSLCVFPGDMASRRCACRRVVAHMSAAPADTTSALLVALFHLQTADSAAQTSTIPERCPHLRS
jgi:hypothetical protein